MMTRDEALERASKILAADGPTFAMAARALIEYTAELRAGAGDPSQHLTLHDVEARQCHEHSTGFVQQVRIAIRDRRASSEWWMHADDQSACA